MSKTIISKDGDMLDALCFTHYGREGMVHGVLHANPHLAKTNAVLEAGIVIILPDMPALEEIPAVNIWS